MQKIVNEQIKQMILAMPSVSNEERLQAMKEATESILNIINSLTVQDFAVIELELLADGIL